MVAVLFQASTTATALQGEREGQAKSAEEHDSVLRVRHGQRMCGALAADVHPATLSQSARIERRGLWTTSNSRTSWATQFRRCKMNFMRAAARQHSSLMSTLVIKGSELILVRDLSMKQRL